jgi:hypothetical protein
MTLRSQVEKSKKVKTSIYLPNDLFWNWKKALVERRISDNDALEQAVRQWLNSPVAQDDAASFKRGHVPRSLATIVEWLVDLYSRTGTPEDELLKNSLRVLAARRSAALKRAR